MAAVVSELNVSVFIVVGFPHDTEAQLRENLPFLDKLAEIGITDIAIAFYMALPGTQIFNSLYDSGKMKIDETYFRHILASTSLWSTSTYCEELSNIQLTMWKFRLFRRFYSQRRARVESDGLTTTVRQAVAALRGKSGDASKLQTAFRNGMVSGLETAKALVQAYGRSCRNADDHGTTYILDAQFATFVQQYRALLPEWFLDATEPALRRQLGL